MDYTKTNRGKIQHPEQKKQIIDFSGVAHKGCTPTDADGLMEFGGRFFTFYEVKFHYGKIPTGQRLALQHMADRIDAGGAEAIVLYLHHTETDPEKEIDASKAELVAFYYRGKQQKTKEIHETGIFVKQQHEYADSKKHDIDFLDQLFFKGEEVRDVYNPDNQ